MESHEQHLIPGISTGLLFRIMHASLAIRTHTQQLCHTSQVHKIEKSKMFCETGSCRLYCINDRKKLSPFLIHLFFIN